MSVKLEDFVARLETRKTVLLFGSGSSMPSGAPSVPKLIAHYAKEFGIDANEYNLAEIASIAASKSSRARVIEELRKLIRHLKPTGGLKNVSLYEWKSIFTTNYDTLIEQSYCARGNTLRVFDSDFSFNAGNDMADCELFKLHGTMEKDISDGINSRIILTESDYEQTEQYREYLYDRLKSDLAGANLIVIGHSLADPDIKTIVNRAAALNAKILSPARICLIMYKEDEQRASLFEERGMTVCFGGIDQFFSAMAPKYKPTAPTATASENPLDKAHGLNPITIVIGEVIKHTPDISSMFNGKPASYADIEGVLCWQHHDDHELSASEWFRVAQYLREQQSVGALFIDDAHRHLLQLNDLVDKLVHAENAYLKIIIASTRNHWFPRIKTPNLFKYGMEVYSSKLEPEEIERLLVLLDHSSEIRALVEDQFRGFNRQEKRRRLAVRCEADMFVCMKNIFANDSFDNIVLHEFASLEQHVGDVYRYVAALETVGVRVHRQLIIRLLSIPARAIMSLLDSLTDIISEYEISEKQGIFGWRCRHPVISGIMTKYKFQDMDRMIKLFDDVIDKISPTYNVEMRSLRELCNVETGVSRISDKNEQNRLLRKMISNAPGERIPRHRLIRNLIDQGLFAKAETEIRLFDKDFGADGPVHRYKIW